MNSKNFGILTLEQRKLLRKKKIPSNVKWNLLNTSSGRLTKKVKELSKDFEIISSSPHCWNWLTSLPVTLSIINLKESLDEMAHDYFVPTKRLKVIKKSGKRLFKVELIDVLTTLSKSESKILEKFVAIDDNLPPRDEKHYLKKLRIDYNLSTIKSKSSLRPKEWKIIKEYYQKDDNLHLFFLPFKEDKFYTWDEVEKELLKGPTTLLKESIK